MENLNKKVLIVEDDKDFIWILQKGFEKQGFSLFIAEDGEEGLKKIEEEKPDLILLDILLPKMDGIIVAKKLKEQGIKTQIIFLSSLMGKVPVAEDLVIEADYITKSSMHIDQLLDKVKQKLGI
jgi:DNA-binding response OmpR family regulator